MTIWNKTRSQYERQPRISQIEIDKQLAELGLFIEQKKLCNAIVTDCTEQVAHFTSAIAGAYIVDDEHPVDEAQEIERIIDARLKMATRPSGLNGVRYVSAVVEDGKLEDVSRFFGGVKASATKSWIEKHL